MKPVMRSALALAGVLALLAAIPGGVRAEEDEGWETWFKLSKETLTSWRIDPVPGDQNRVYVADLQLGSGPMHKAMVLYSRSSSAYDQAMSTLLDVFQERDVDTHFSIAKFRRDDARGKAALALAESEGDELIVAMGSESAAWLYDNYKGGKLPVVTVCSKDPVELGQMTDYDSGSGTNMAFTSLNMPVVEQMAYLRELWPALKNIAVLVDSQNESAVRTQADPLIRLARERGITAFDVAVQDPAKAQAELAVLVPKAVEDMQRTDPDLKNSVFWVTGSTSVFREIATINRAAGRVPVLSAVPDVVKADGQGAVMSIGVGFVSNAHLAALYAADVLSGRAKAGSLKVGVVSPPDISIDFRRARAIGFRVPFAFFERASTVYDGAGHLVRADGKRIPSNVQSSDAAPTVHRE